ncbi:AI-2E family transporter [Orrella daihaiensis]|uniref:AI-2E family transporter n=1 Tax=Orrella daihaiensis TaxID=2782176 RepID=A0ABY4AIJ7_9BURK|nr:AI-2E family transporter [Orrella daihaiensis]UOD49758.1 AI-2E family transporter [Orrella daihaiensis]
MSQTDPMHNRAFIVLLVVITLAFAWLLVPFAAAVFWAVVIAILFYPLQKRLVQRMPKRRNLAACLSLLAVILVVLLPVSLVMRSLIAETIQVYRTVQSGGFSAGEWIELSYNAIPESVRPWLTRVGFDDLEAIKDYVSRAATQAIRVIGNQALSLGQNTFLFVLELGIMMYLLFFLLRDGAKLADLVRRALPLADHQRDRFIDKLAMVVRATVKGNGVVAIVQGALGGLIFWVLGIPSATLWGTVMAVLSLLPAVGAGLVWGPVAIYFALTGDLVQAAILGLYGVLVIGLVDNLLRPVLVGKDTRMPDYLVLISTLSGLTLFGISGFIAGPLIAALFLVAWDLFMMRPDHGVRAPLN